MRRRNGLQEIIAGTFVAILFPALACAQTFQGTGRLVIAPTTVTDPAGNLVEGLDLKDFQLTDNGTKQVILEDLTFQPISLVVVVQSSDKSGWALAKVRRLGSMIELLVLGRGGQAAVVSYADRVEVVREFTADSSQVRNALLDIKSEGAGHRLIDGVGRAVSLLEQTRRRRRRVILLVGEPFDSGSEDDLRGTLNDLQRQNIMVYALQMSHTKSALEAASGGSLLNGLRELYRGAKAGSALNTLKLLVDYTGGREYAFSGQSTLETAVQKIARELHGQYLLSYTPDSAGTSGFHEIRVAVNRPAVQIRARPGYWETDK